MKKIFIAITVSAAILFAKDAYKPKFEALKVAGATLYVLGDDRDEAIEEGTLDQYWFYEILKNKKPLPKNVTLVDLRVKERYDAEHIEGAVNVPYDDKTEKIDLSKLPKKGAIIFYCRKGMKSIAVRGMLKGDLAKRSFVFDATYKCDKKYKNCKLTPNEFI